MPSGPPAVLAYLTHIQHDRRMVTWFDLPLTYLTQRRRQIAVAMAVALVLQLGFIIPEPVLFAKQMTSAYAQLARPPLFSLGLLAWPVALGLVELLCLIVPPLAKSDLATGGHADPFSRAVMGLTAGLSFYFSSRTAAAAMVLFEPESLPSPLETVEAAISFTAGTMAVIALGKWLETAYRTLGFWTLVFITGFIGLSKSFQRLWQAIADHQMTGQQVAMLAAALLVPVAAAVLLFDTNRARRGPANSAFLFPWLFVAYGPGLVIGFLPASVTQSPAWQAFWPDYGFATLAAVQTALLALFYYLYLARHGARLHAVMAFGIGFITLLLPFILGPPFPVSGLQILILGILGSDMLNVARGALRDRAGTLPDTQQG